MKISVKILLLLLALCPAIAVAQNATMTPYSRYGYGMLSDGATSAQRAMGGTGVAMSGGRQINVMNPASYSALDSLNFIFDMGADLTFLWQNEGAAKHSQTGGGLEYITMAFPLWKRLGASIGVLPYSSVGYAFGSDVTNGTVSRAGSGSLNQAYVGLGYELFPRFSLGLNFAYLFGSTVHDTYAFTGSGASTLFEREMRVRDWTLDLGAQYAINLNTRTRLTLGFRFSPGKDLHGETFGVYYDASNSSNSSTSSSTEAVKVDTVGYTKLNGRFSLPATFAGGVNLQWAGRLMVEADFIYQPWKDAKFAKIEGFEYTEYANRWRASLGMQFVPNPRGSYFRRLIYRAGAYLNHDYIMVLGNNVREYGASVGFGFPVPGYKTQVNLGFEYKHRQAHPAALVKEDYFNITLGVNFNEMWFRKNKIR